MGAAFIFSVISTLSSLLSSIRKSGATSVDGSADGIEKDLDRLERLMKRIQAALRDAGEREIRDEYVKLWLKELQAVAYEAEDILDECQYELLRLQIEDSGEAGSSSADGKKRKRLDGVISVEMAERIKNVIEQFDEISRDKDALCLKEDDGERRGSVWTGMLPTSHLVNESAIFGRDHDKQKILDFVLSNNIGRINPISVMAIVGMGGVGKTTLAQLVYNDSIIQNYFDLRAWVYVSPDFDVIRITKEILENISSRELFGGFTGLSAAQKALLEVVQKKKILIVLDDVWNGSPSRWERLIEPLRDAELARVIVTTRDKAVAQITEATEIHDLSRLSEDQSRLLFEQYAFGGNLSDYSSFLMRIGLQIIRKCAGIPLAIKSLGRLLRCKLDEDTWRCVLTSELWESDGKDDIFPALKVSYHNLPSAMKPCFLFCSLFPKGSSLEKNKIIYMWIAHGYIQSRDGKRAEALGNEFINELDSRSFLTKKSYWGGKEEITMHDLIHDLARSISIDEFCSIAPENVGNICTEAYHTYAENFVKKDRSRRSCLLMRTLINKDTRRNFGLENAGYITDLMGLRVLKWEGAHVHDLKHIANLKHLRYLEINKCALNHEDARLPASISLLYNLVALELRFLPYLTELPIHVERLINLRYLSINHVGIWQIPESLGKLCNLQSLSLSHCPHLTNLPPSIGNIIYLKQLYISDLKIRELPESFCALQKLQTLSLNKCWYLTLLPSDIGNLIDLQEIYVCGNGIKTLPESISHLDNLEILELDCRASPVEFLCKFEGLLTKSSLNFSIINTKFGETTKFSETIWGESDQNKMEPLSKYVKTKRFIESLKPVIGLVKLEINGHLGVGYASWFENEYPTVAIGMHCHVKSNNFFAELGCLPSLESLTLLGITSIQNLVVDPSQYSISCNSKVLFPSLKCIELIKMFELDSSVIKRDGDFPVLESLKIENCPKLRSVPNIGNLRSLEIVRCSFSKLELNLLPVLQLESLHIEECIQLTLIQGLQCLDCIQIICIIRCPLLKEIVFPRMPNFHISIEITECPSLKRWSRSQLPDYIKGFSSKKLVTSGIWYIMKTEYQKAFIEHLVIQDCKGQSIKLPQGLYNLRSLEIRRCKSLNSLHGLNELKLLRSLVLWDCPILQLKNSCESRSNGEIPVSPFLQSLTIHECHRLLSLNLLVEDPSSLKNLNIKDCKQLKYIRDIQKLDKLKYMSIIRCPLLLLQPLLNVPDHVIVSGCSRLKGWCKWHSVELLDEMKPTTEEGLEEVCSE